MLGSPLTASAPEEAAGRESGKPKRLTHLFLFFLWTVQLQGRGEGSGLSALLPQPKNLTVKETNRVLLPYAFSRKAGENASDSKAAKAPTSSSKPKPPPKAAVPTTPSPSAIKAAAKSAALQVTKQITQEEDDSDEELEPENYFSLSDRSEPGAAGAETYLYPGTVVSEDPPPGTELEPQFQDAAANAPLEFKTGMGSSGAQHGWAPKPGEDYGSQPYGQFPAYGEAGVAGAYYQVGSASSEKAAGTRGFQLVTGAGGGLWGAELSFVPAELERGAGICGAGRAGFGLLLDKCLTAALF